MSNMIKHHERLARKWESMYRDWEEGRLPSPSPDDLVGVALELFMVDLSEGSRTLLAESTFDRMGDGCELRQLAEWMVSMLAVTNVTSTTS